MSPHLPRNPDLQAEQKVWRPLHGFRRWRPRVTGGAGPKCGCQRRRRAGLAQSVMSPGPPRVAPILFARSRLGTWSTLLHVRIDTIDITTSTVSWSQRGGSFRTLRLVLWAKDG